MKTFDAESYARWRARIPFTDAQIADALETQATTERPFLAQRRRWMAEQCRIGHVSAKAMQQALPILVATCGLCGKRAWYRYGCIGRCRAHRHLITPNVSWVRQQLEDRASRMAALRDDAERDIRRRLDSRTKESGRVQKDRRI